MHIISKAFLSWIEERALPPQRKKMWWLLCPLSIALYSRLLVLLLTSVHPRGCCHCRCLSSSLSVQWHSFAASTVILHPLCSPVQPHCSKVQSSRSAFVVCSIWSRGLLTPRGYAKVRTSADLSVASWLLVPFSYLKILDSWICKISEHRVVPIPKNPNNVLPWSLVNRLVQSAEIVPCYFLCSKRIQGDSSRTFLNLWWIALLRAQSMQLFG